mmetsp:Transcript_7861/g.18347  ORF Transcript_7861/g.18347 Transcript_7861/m.18347 type:complete len:256 (+) Transcript_7861:1124-1891(+)
MLLQLASLFLAPHISQADLQNRMGPGRVDVCAGDTRRAAGKAVLNHLHEFSDILNEMFLQSNNDNVGLGVLPCVEELAIVQQVKEFPTIDLIEGYVHTQMAVLLAIQTAKDVLSCKQEDAWGLILLTLAFGRTHHSEGLPAACLPIRKASTLSLLEHRINDRPYTRAVQALIRCSLVKRLVKEEVVLFDVTSEVHLQLRLPNYHSIATTHHYILLPCCLLLGIHRPLPHNDAQSRSAPCLLTCWCHWWAPWRVGR